MRTPDARSRTLPRRAKRQPCPKAVCLHGDRQHGGERIWLVDPGIAGVLPLKASPRSPRQARRKLSTRNCGGFASASAMRRRDGLEGMSDIRQGRCWFGDLRLRIIVGHRLNSPSRGPVRERRQRPPGVKCGTLLSSPIRSRGHGCSNECGQPVALSRRAATDRKISSLCHIRGRARRAVGSA